MAKINNYILVCGGTGCRASRSEEIIAALESRDCAALTTAMVEHVAKSWDRIKSAL